MRVILPLVGTLALGCNDNEITADPNAVAPPPPEFRVKLPTGDFVGHVAGARQAELQAAIDKLLAWGKTDQEREEIRQLINSEHLIVAAGDPEVAQLFQTIYEIRTADLLARDAVESRERVRRMGTIVTVALVENMPVPTARAVILRRARTSPQNVILLPSSRATAADLADATSMFFGLRAAHGDVLPADARVVVPARVSPRPARAERTMQPRLDALRSAPHKEIAGVGNVRAIEVPLGPVKAPRGGAKGT